MTTDFDAESDDGFLMTWKKTQERHVQAHAIDGEEVKHCPKCENTYPATKEHWHRDSYSDDGFQTHCKMCRNLQAEKDRKADQADKIAAAQKNLMDRIVLETNAGRGLTPGSEIQEHAVDMFGGSKGLATELVATYAAAKPGSAIREKILRLLYQSALKLEESGLATKKVEEMTDEELKAEMQKQLRIFDAESA